VGHYWRFWRYGFQKWSRCDGGHSSPARASLSRCRGVAGRAREAALRSAAANGLHPLCASALSCCVASTPSNARVAGGPTCYAGAPRGHPSSNDRAAGGLHFHAAARPHRRTLRGVYASFVVHRRTHLHLSGLLEILEVSKRPKKRPPARCRKRLFPGFSAICMLSEYIESAIYGA